MSVTVMGSMRPFQSTHPVRGATSCASSHTSTSTVFQSTHPVRGATRYTILPYRVLRFQSTHPVRGATAVETTWNLFASDFNPRTP